jgi:hypothetical protein
LIGLHQHPPGLATQGPGVLVLPVVQAHVLAPPLQVLLVGAALPATERPGRTHAAVQGRQAGVHKDMSDGKKQGPKTA